MPSWQHSLNDAAEQDADQRQSKCNKRNCNRSHAIPRGSLEIQPLGWSVKRYKS